MIYNRKKIFLFLTIFFSLFGVLFFAVPKLLAVPTPTVPANDTRKIVNKESNCGNLIDAKDQGGMAILINKVTITGGSGTVTITWDFIDVPDRLEVYDANDKRIAFTGDGTESYKGGYTNHTGTINVPFVYNSDDPAKNYLTIVAYGGEYELSGVRSYTTAWSYKVNCPVFKGKNYVDQVCVPDCDISGSLVFTEAERDCACCQRCTICNFVNVFLNVARVGLGFLGIISLLMFMIGGIIWITASGNSDRINKGKSILTGTITGIIIVLVAWVLINTTVIILTDEKNSNGVGTIFGSPWNVCPEPDELIID